MRLRDRRIHFMGIGGIGVSALARFARSRGAIVSGCDRQESGLTRDLRQSGIPVAIGHAAEHVADVDLLVYSSAVPPEHPERAAAPAQERRGEFLARFMNEVPSWGVAGTHGKTTTSWLLAHILIQAGLDPSVFIGGIVPELPGGNYRLGGGPFVAELDESDATFLLPRLEAAVITNVESDHLAHYGDDASLFAAFERFAGGVAASGLLAAGWDSPVARNIYEKHAGRKISFGVEDGAELRATDIEYAGGGTAFTALLRGGELGRFTLTLPGLHNVQNALAALAASVEMGVGVETAGRALASARGVERRMEALGRLRGAVLYSDYAHHPTEVRAAIAALRRRHPGPTLVVFQPHLYSRTRDYADAFAQALSTADRLLMVDIYPAREEPIPGVTSALAMPKSGPSAVRGPVPLERVAEEAAAMAEGCEAVVMMGAGDIDAAARDIAGADGE